MDKVKKYLGENKLYNYQLPIMLVFLALMFVAMYMGAIGNTMISVMTFTLVFGLVLSKLGDMVPFLSKYLNLGLLLSMFLPSYMVYKNWFTESFVDGVKAFFPLGGGAEYLTFFIVLLMAASMLTIDRKTLLRCLARYIPLLAITFLGAIGGVALVAGIMGIDVKQSILEFSFPIMGSGTAGAAALSQIMQSVTGQEVETYYGTIVAIVVLASTMCSFFAAGFNILGNIFPKLTGDKKTLLRGKKDEVAGDKSAAIQLPKASVIDVVSGLILAGVLYIVAGVIAKLIPPIGGITLHQYAYFIIVLTVANCTGIVPKNIVSGLKTLSGVCSGLLMPMICVCIGITLVDWASFVNAFKGDTVILIVACILSASIVAAIFGWLFGMYPIDSAITAALCQANMGGGADIGVLTMGDRMELIPYAAISSRIGYAIILVMASILYPILLR